MWVLRRCDWENREGVIKSALNHQNWRVRRLAVEILIATNLHDDSFCRKMVQDLDPEVQMEAVFGLKDPIEICQILTEILPLGVADIQRLRYQAAIYLARHGSVLQIENLVKNQNRNIRLTGLIALDEAMYNLSNKYENTRLKEIPNLMVKLINNDIALKEITGIAARWPTNGIKEKISLKLINQLKKEKNLDSFTNLLGLLKLIKWHKKPVVRTLSLDWVKSFAKVSPSELSPKEEKLLSLLIEINGVSQLSNPIIKHMIKGGKLATYLINKIVRDISKQQHRKDLIKQIILDKKYKQDLRIKLLIAFHNTHSRFDENLWKQMLCSNDTFLVASLLRLINFHPNKERAVNIIRNIEKTILTAHGKDLQPDLDFALSRDRFYEDLDKKVLSKIARGNASLGKQSFMSRTCYACHGPQVPQELAPSLKRIGSQPNRYLVESILQPSKVVKTGYLVGDQSTMPAGLEKTMSETELVDLIAYLKTL